MSWPVGKPQAQDISGRSFNRLTVISRADSRGDGRAYWKCKCSCGNYRIVSGSDLRSGHTKSCGCLAIETSKSKATTHGYGTKAKGRRDKTYLAWLNMHRRCSNPKDRGYANYGGRGIRVCRDWTYFENFLADMGEAPANCSLERIDVNGDYKPSNCKWATYEDQCNNKRTTVYVELNQERMSMAQAAKKLSVSPGRVRWAVQKLGDRWLEHVRAAAAIGGYRE